MASKEPSMTGYGRCPICGDAAETAFRPFCSARCRDVDLARWLGGGYAIPGGRVEADEDGADADPLGTREDKRRDGGDDPA
jgi:endogenous inhibitor of DNA gyrase (YacG/DUF329 family)